MMIKTLRYLSDEALFSIKYGDKEKFRAQMAKHPDNSDWIVEYLTPIKPVFIDSNFSFEFKFTDFSPKKNEEDLENAIAIFELFEKHNLKPAIIYNEKFLTGFILTYGYQYFMNVMGASKISHVFATLFFENDTHRSIARNIVGKMYRAIQMTVDNSSEDKYWLSRYVLKNKSLLRLKYYTFADGETTHKAYFTAFKEWSEETGLSPNGTLAESVRLKLSFLTNVSDTDFMSEAKLKSILKAYIYSLNLTQ